MQLSFNCLIIESASLSEFAVCLRSAISERAARLRLSFCSPFLHAQVHLIIYLPEASSACLRKVMSRMLHWIIFS